MKKLRLPRMFIALTLVVLVSDAAFVVANYFSARDALRRAMEAEGDKLHSGYDVAMAMTSANMLQLATFISTDPDIKEIVAEGKRAVLAEGGGKGGTQAARIRERLLTMVRGRWELMTREFGVRQLHFHLSPGSLSFLRVHAPEKFGDRMDDLRHIIVDVNHDHQPRTGLETGRIYTGLRGVVPLMGAGAHPDSFDHVGALEVGSSFGPILDALDKRLGAGVAVLLRKQHVDEAMWSEFIKRHLPSVDTPCECFVETSSREEVYEVLRDDEFRRIYADRPVTMPVSVGERVLSVTRFPLRDYLGDGDAGRPPVGSVMVWVDRTAAYRAFQQGQMFNIAYGVFAFLLVEAVLWAGMRFGEGRMRVQLLKRTEELRAVAERNRAILDGAAEGICGLDRSGATVFVNRAAAGMLGWKQEELLGRPHHALIHHSRADGSPYDDSSCPVLLSMADAQVRHVSGEVFWRKDKTCFATDYTVGPLIGAGGKVDGAVVIFRDDTERLLAQREIAEKTAALETSNGELEQFASIISHDLQSPLRMVVAYLGLIDKRLGPDLDAETREFLDFAVDGGKRMSVMIRDLLAYSRVGRGGGELEPVALDDVISLMEDDLSPAIAESGATIVVSDHLPTVLGRRVDLVRLLENLVGNAIKYRVPDRAPVIRISASNWDGKVRIDVDDNGIGIPEDQRERVFAFFHRVDQQPGEDGSGIGLAVARKIASQHGGRIWVEEGPDAVGSRFSVTLLPAGA